MSTKEPVTPCNTTEQFASWLNPPPAQPSPNSFLPSLLRSHYRICRAIRLVGRVSFCTVNLPHRCIVSCLRLAAISGVQAIQSKRRKRSYAAYPSAQQHVRTHDEAFTRMHTSMHACMSEHPKVHLNTGIGNDGLHMDACTYASMCGCM